MKCLRIGALVLASTAGFNVQATTAINPIYGNERNNGLSDRAPRRFVTAQGKPASKQLAIQKALRFASFAPPPRHDALLPSYILGSRPLSNWSAYDTDIWQTELPVRPSAVRRNNAWLSRAPNAARLSDQGWTWTADTLLVKDSAGNPDVTAKTISALISNDGWSITAGDFNGDGFADVASGLPFSPDDSANAGRIHVYFGGKTVSTAPAQALAGNDNERLGTQVASAGDVNNDGYDDLLVATDWGVNKVYLYSGSPAGLNSEPRLLEAPGDYGAYGFGHGLALRPGDLNKDGFDDVIIARGSTPTYVTVHYGSSDGIKTEPGIVVEYPNTGNSVSLSIIGDHNGDGIDDLAVAVGQEQLPATSFSVYVYHGSTNGMAPKADNVIAVDLPPADAVYRNGTVGPAGDINGDGYADLLVGNEWANGDFDLQGEAYVYYGGPQGSGTTADVKINNPEPGYNARFGTSLNAVGDFGRDGIDDFAIGSPYRRNGGAVYVYAGSKNFDASRYAMLTDSNDSFGWSIAAVGKLRNKRNRYMAVGAEFGGVFVYKSELKPANAAAKVLNPRK